MSLWMLSKDEAKADLGIGDTTDDAVLTRAMEGLQDRFDLYADRTFLRGSNVTEYHDGGVRSILLRRFPVESVASVHWSDDDTWDATTLVDASEYRLVADRGRIYYGVGSSPWPAGVRVVRVIYTGGYVAAGTNPTAGQTAMPEALRRAFAMQLGYEWRNRRTLGAQSVSGQGASVSLAPAALLPEVKAVLDGMARM